MNKSIEKESNPRVCTHYILGTTPLWNRYEIDVITYEVVRRRLS